MKLNIHDKKEQKLLSRLEVKGRLEFDGSTTPSNDAVRESVAKNVGKDAKLVVIKSIYTDYGKASADVRAYVYDSEAKLKNVERVKEDSKKESAEKPKEEWVKKASESAAPSGEPKKEESGTEKAEEKKE